jgi:hypothetical protein
VAEAGGKAGEITVRVGVSEIVTVLFFPSPRSATSYRIQHSHYTATTHYREQQSHLNEITNNGISPPQSIATISLSIHQTPPAEPTQ